MSYYVDVRGFCYLEPRRHIRYITELDGEEATTFGVVLAKTTDALRRATQASLIYIYIFGGTNEHLHVHLAPHVTGDSLCAEITHSPSSARMTQDAFIALTSDVRSLLGAGDSGNG